FVRAHDAVGGGGRRGGRLLLHGLRDEVGGDHAPRRAVHSDREVLRGQAADGSALLVHDVDVHRHHVHVGAEDRTRGRPGSGRTHGRRGRRRGGAVLGGG